jgi:SAM-dependent methyltransferase
MFYLGNAIASVACQALTQDFFVKNFKTGNTMNFLDFPAEDYKVGQLVGRGVATEMLFSRRLRDFKRKFEKRGYFLEVGCGYGFNLETWVKKYKSVRFVGIDIDPKGIAGARELILRNNWEDRVELFKISVSDYAKANKQKFDLIMLNQVLHEMDTDENYRRQVIENIYTMLKDDGLFIVRENMMPDLFTPSNKIKIGPILHKLLDIPFGSRFYNEDSFKKFIGSTSFKNAELVKEIDEGGDENYFWAITK